MRAAITAVVLAGGRGTRIAAVYSDVPKPMIPVAGKPFLHWITLHLARAGVTRVVYATGYRGDQIAAWCGDGSIAGVTRLTSSEDRARGTGGALLQTLPLCGDIVLVVNGDSLCLGGTAALLSLAAWSEIDGGVIGVHVDDTARYGRLEINATKRLLSFQEKVAGAGLINAGMYLFRKTALQALDLPAVCSIEHDILPALLRNDAYLHAVVPPHAPFIDIGTPQSLATAAAFIAAHRDDFIWPTASRFRSSPADARASAVGTPHRVPLDPPRRT